MHHLGPDALKREGADGSGPAPPSSPSGGSGSWTLYRMWISGKSPRAALHGCSSAADVEIYSTQPLVSSSSSARLQDVFLFTGSCVFGSSGRGDSWIGHKTVEGLFTNGALEITPKIQRAPGPVAAERKWPWYSSRDLSGADDGSLSIRSVLFRVSLLTLFPSGQCLLTCVPVVVGNSCRDARVMQVGTEWYAG